MTDANSSESGWTDDDTETLFAALGKYLFLFQWIAEWLQALANVFRDWKVYSSSRLDDPDYIWDPQVAIALRSASIEKVDALHLAVSMRSFR